MNVLFVCTGNTCRSPMAHAVFEKFVAERNIDAVSDSAGLAAYEDETADPHAISVMQEIGMDLSGYQAKNITPKLLETADFIFVMSQMQQQNLCAFDPALASKVKVMEIDDPYGKGLDEYRKCRDEIVRYIDNLLEQ